MGNVAETLLEAKNVFIEKEWIQGELADFDEDAQEVNMQFNSSIEQLRHNEEKVNGVCMMGALYLVNKHANNPHMLSPYTKVLAGVIEEEYPYLEYPDVAPFNDWEETTRAMVMDIFDKAIARAKDEDL